MTGLGGSCPGYNYRRVPCKCRLWRRQHQCHGWASSESITAVATFVLEVGYGCNVSVVPTDTIPAVTSLAENG